MAFKDGMLAVVKVLKIVAVGLAVLSFALGIADRSFLVGTFMAVTFFAFFWTPAWIIKKFVQ